MFPDSRKDSYSFEKMRELGAVRRLERKIELRRDLARQRRLIEVRCNSRPSTSTAGSTSSSPGLNPREIFPTEVWEKILSFLDDPTAICNAAETCQLFRDISKQRLLLPEVLGVLHDQGYISFKEALGCRLRSKWFRYSVDKVFYENRFSKDNWYLNYDPSDETFKRGSLSFKNVDEITDFISTFSSSPPSAARIWTRQVILSPSFQGEDGSKRIMEFYAATSRFLQLFGSSIWCFIYTSNSEISLRAFHDRVRNWAHHLPNLKLLVINGEGMYRLSQEEKKESEELEREMRRISQFPAIPSLRAYEGRQVPLLLSDAIARSNPWVKHLVISQRFAENETKAKALETLGIESTRTMYSGLTGPVTNFYKGIGAHWPLKKISLVILEEVFIAAKLFRLLSQFRETLENVEIVFRFNCGLKEANHSTLFLDLPKLKELKCKSFEACPSLDFICPLGSLERLHLSAVIWTAEDCEALHPNDIIDFYPCLFQDRFEQCNIWEFLPSLKDVEIALKGRTALGHEDGEPRIWKFERGRRILNQPMITN